MKKIAVILLVVLSLISYRLFSQQQVAEPVKWKYSIENIDAKHVNLIFEAQIESKWHLYSQHFDLGGPMPLFFKFTTNENFILIDSVIEKNNPKAEYDDVFEVNVKYFEKEAKFIQQIELKTDSGFNIIGNIEGQACFEDGACIPINSDFVFKINGGSADQGSIQNTNPSNNNTPIIVTANDFTSNIDNNSSIWSFFFLSLAFGILAILTPCVFPMIPMTISFFMNDKQKKINGIIKAFTFGISITLLYTLVGVIVSLTSAGANFTTVLSTHWIPNLIFFLLFLIFAASLFGLFEFILPSSIANKADSQVDKGGIMASFFMALTTVIVSFSCTGPIIGALLVKAASGNVLEPAIGMFGFGLGFALPFTILAISPQWLNKLPKSGGWLNSVKVVMGFVILAFSLKYFSNIDQNYHLSILSRELYIAIWIVISLLLGFYLLGKISFKHDSEVKKVGFFRLILAGSALIFAVYLFPGLFGANLNSVSSLLPPKYTQEFDLTKQNSQQTDNQLCESARFSDVLHTSYNTNSYFDYKQAINCANNQNKPILYYFTGHSCANCKKMQAAIWSDPNINSIFNNEVILTTLYVDEKSIELSDNEWFTSSKDNKIKKNLGDINADIQIVNFNVNTQPFYALVSPDGKVLCKPMTYTTDTEEFAKFLKSGLESYKKNN